MRTVHGVDELRALVGQNLGTSAWHTVTQERIDAFAAATDDYDGIHVDPVRAVKTPFGVTIAHGLYTLSLGPKFMYELFTITGHSHGLNYGYDKVRFVSPVLVGARVRMTAHLSAVEPLENGGKFRFLQTFEIEGESKPACVAESILAYFD